MIMRSVLILVSILLGEKARKKTSVSACRGYGPEPHILTAVGGRIVPVLGIQMGFTEDVFGGHHTPGQVQAKANQPSKWTKTVELLSPDNILSLRMGYGRVPRCTAYHRWLVGEASAC